MKHYIQINIMAETQDGGCTVGEWEGYRDVLIAALRSAHDRNRKYANVFKFEIEASECEYKRDFLKDGKW